jgi:hypothetical protein
MSRYLYVRIALLVAAVVALAMFGGDPWGPK